MKGFVSLFTDSAKELKSVKCLTVTAMLIALAVVLKSIMIPIGETLKISFSFLSLASIGMLFGPVVAGISGIITDILGFVVKPTGAFSPIFTVVEATGGVLYGIFLYRFRPSADSFEETMSKRGREWFISMIKQAWRIIAAKFFVSLVCNVFMNTAALIAMGYIAADVAWASIVKRVIKNITMFPIEVVLMYIVLLPILAAYERVFKLRRVKQH